MLWIEFPNDFKIILLNFVLSLLLFKFFIKYEEKYSKICLQFGKIFSDTNPIIIFIVMFFLIQYYKIFLLIKGT